MYLSTMNGIVSAPVPQPAPAAAPVENTTENAAIPTPMEVDPPAPETPADLAAPAADANAYADADIQGRELARAHFSAGGVLPRPVRLSWDGWCSHTPFIEAQSAISGRYAPRCISRDGLNRLKDQNAPTLGLLNGAFTAKTQMYLLRVLEAFTGSIAITKPLSSASAGEFRILSDDGLMDDLVAYTCNPHTGLVVSLSAKSTAHKVDIQLTSLDYVQPEAQVSADPMPPSS